MENNQMIPNGGCIGTVCELGNINGCPHSETCKCHEHWVDRIRAANGYPPLDRSPPTSSVEQPK